MPYDKNDENLIVKVNEIIRLNDEAFVEYYIKRADERYYFISSFDDLKDLLKRIEPLDFVIVYKKKQLPLRGIVDRSFEEKVLNEYSTKMRDNDYAFFDYVMLYSQKN